MILKVGYKVKYREVKSDKEFIVHVVRSVHPKGIPSCPIPLVKLSDKAGVVLPSHCELIKEGDTDE